MRRSVRAAGFPPGGRSIFQTTKGSFVTQQWTTISGLPSRSASATAQPSFGLTKRQRREKRSGA